MTEHSLSNPGGCIPCIPTDDLRSYLFEQLAAEREDEVLAHLDKCPACRGLLAELSDDALVREYLGATQRHESATQCISLDDRVAASESLYPAQSEVAWMGALIDERTLPTKFGRFELREQLGSGGFGAVYLAHDTDLERTVAIKIPHLIRLSPGFRSRLIREGKAAACLHHPNIVAVLEAGECENLSYIVTDYIPGQTLQRYTQEWPNGLSPGLAARIILPIVKAVEHAHENGIIHCDIKGPSTNKLPKFNAA